jgi:hypothetical protein
MQAKSGKLEVTEGLIQKVDSSTVEEKDIKFSQRP